MENPKNIFDPKDPNSTEMFACNFPTASQTNEIVAARVRVVVPGPTPADAPVADPTSALVIEGDPVVVGGQVRAMISGGKMGQTYRVEFEADFTNGETINFERKLTVKNR